MDVKYVITNKISHVLVQTMYMYSIKTFPKTIIITIGQGQLGGRFSCGQPHPHMDLPPQRGHSQILIPV